MVEVKIKELKYIRDIPLEMLQEAVDAGELRKGKIIGILVRPVGIVSSEDFLIELKLTDDRQGDLIKIGAILPVDSCGSLCFLSPEWHVYLEKLYSEEKVQLRNFNVVVQEDRELSKITH